MNVWNDGGVPDLDKCKIIKQLRSLSLYAANLSFMANRIFGIEGRLIRLRTTICDKDIGGVITEKAAKQAELDYERDIELENSYRHGHTIDKATFLEVCKKIYEQKGEV